MTSESNIRVRYAETDQMGVVYHANYLVWFEVGRTDFIRKLGLNYLTMEKEEGCHIAVVDLRVRYKAPARYDDELTVRTRLTHVRGSILSFGYVIYRAADDLILTEATTTHIVVGRDMKRTAMPPRYAAIFQSTLLNPPQL
jgi:acyl-CoA thioester hydrolase